MNSEGFCNIRRLKDIKHEVRVEFQVRNIDAYTSSPKESLKVIGLQGRAVLPEVHTQNRYLVNEPDSFISLSTFGCVTVRNIWVKPNLYFVDYVNHLCIN